MERYIPEEIRAEIPAIEKVLKDPNFGKRENDPTLNEAIDSLNFDLIKSIFKEELFGHNSAEAAERLIPPSRVLALSKNFPAYATYNPEMAVIGIGTKKIKEVLETRFPNRPDILRLFILHNFFHEQVHAVTGQEEKGRTLKLGYETQVIGLIGYRQFFNSLNEAVTDRFARELENKYIRSTNFETAEAQKIWNDFYDQSYLEQPEMKVLNRVISLLAEATGFSETDVWRSFVGGMLRAEQIGEEEVKEVIEELTYPGFVHDWSDILSKDEAQKVLDKLEGRAPVQSENLKQKFLNLFKKNE